MLEIEADIIDSRRNKNYFYLVGTNVDIRAVINIELIACKDDISTVVTLFKTFEFLNFINFLLCLNSSSLACLVLSTFTYVYTRKI